MIEIDAGHSFELDVYDSSLDYKQLLTFMKREGAGYPFNVGHYSGTNCQEVLRALIVRMHHLQKQIACSHNETIIQLLRQCLWLFEARAAERHDVSFDKFDFKSDFAIEYEPTCKQCGHIVCKGTLMRKGGGKAKGSGYEREIGYKLSLWLSNNTRKDIVCRTVGSGAQFTSANMRGTTAGIPGDLRSQDPVADKFFQNVVLECKFWADLELLHFLDQKSLLHEALIKVKSEAESLNKYYWLVARQNRRYDIVFMPIEAMSRSSIILGSNVKYHCLFNGQVYMFKLDEFLGYIKPDEYLFKDNI
jgi:hypothetical protein